MYPTVRLSRQSTAGFDVVFKVQETCNLNCSYCYMYNVGNTAFEIVPQQASLLTCMHVAKVIADEFVRRDADSARLILHGGEVMLMKPTAMNARLEVIDNHLRATLTESQYLRFKYSIQTNATLVTPEWKELIEKWKMGVGVSIDGLKENHDQYRTDKRNRGTYDRVVAGLMSLRNIRNYKGDIGALCVINPNADGRETYRHLVDDLKFSSFNFLLPFMNWDSYNAEQVAGVGRFLSASFQEWASDRSKGRKISVRIFKEAMQYFGGGINLDVNRTCQEISYEVFVVESDGTIMVEDSLRPTFENKFSELNVSFTSLQAITEQEEYVRVEADTFSLANECFDCALITSCRSGSSLGRVGMRYSRHASELRKSVFCEAFKELFMEVAIFQKRLGQEVSDFLYDHAFDEKIAISPVVG